MWYYRAIREEIIGAANHFPALVLTGARQAGKTALLRRLFPNHSYVSLDMPSVAQLAEHEPLAFLERYPAPLLVDEVQYAPQLFRHLKLAIDLQRHQMGQFVLTGSQKFVLMKNVADSLAGRCALFDLENLSVREITQHQPSPTGAKSLAQMMVRGGFPELWRDPEIPSDLFFASYLSTYLERDVRQILNVSSLRDFERFIRACAARNGQSLDKSAIARDVGVSHKAIGDWISVLEASNQIVLLEPWFANIGKRLVKSPKLYFSDSGLLCYLLGLTSEMLLTSPYLGAIWEGFVFSELRRSIAIANRSTSLWYYRDKQQTEVDFMLLGGGFARLIECKWSELPTTTDTKGMSKVVQNVAGKSVADFSRHASFVLCRTKEDFPIHPECWAINLFDLARHLEL